MSAQDEGVLAARLTRAGQRADRVAEFADSVMRAVHTRPSISGDQFLVLNFLARGLSTLRAVRLLVENGLSGDATSSMRTLVELDIDLAYIVAKPEPRLQRFYEYDSVVYARMIDDNPGVVPEVVAKAARARRDQVWKHFKNHKFRWTEASIRKRAEETSRKRSYVTAYALGCHATHSGMGTLGYSLDAGKPGEMRLATSTQRATAEPINFAAGAVFRLIGSVANYLAHDCSTEAEEVARVFDDASTER